MFRHQITELLGFIAWPIIAFILSLRFSFSPFVSIFVFYGPLCLYLCLKKPKHAPKAAIFAVVFGTPLMFVVDYIAHLTNTWYLYNTLPRIARYITIEDVTWAIVWIFLTIMFYEHFLHHRVAEKIWGPKMKYVVIALIFLIVAFALCAVNFSKLLFVPYFYLAMGGVVILIPILFEAFDHPKVFLTFLGTAAYFFYFHIVYEIAGLRFHWWSFPGTQFIGYVSIFGSTFPFEEFLFWIVLGAFAILSCFKLFDVVQKREF